MNDARTNENAIKVAQSYCQDIGDIIGHDILQRGTELVNPSYQETPPLTVIWTLLDVIAMCPKDKEGDFIGLPDEVTLGIIVTMSRALADMEVAV